jgi:hypothetical protein
LRFGSPCAGRPAAAIQPPLYDELLRRGKPEPRFLCCLDAGGGGRSPLDGNGSC